MKSQSVTIQTKAAEQHVPVMLLMMLYKAALSFESVNESQLMNSAFLWYCLLFRTIARWF